MPVEQSHAQGPTRGQRSAKQRFHLRRKRVPELIQMSSTECGAACLAMILSYHGRATAIAEVRDRCGVGRDGLSALAIVKAARQYGLRVRAVSLPRNDMRFVPVPAIVHWEFNHFVVLERWSLQHVDIVDPALGRRRLSAQEFDEGFTGVVIELEPGIHLASEACATAFVLELPALGFSRAWLPGPARTGLVAPATARTRHPVADKGFCRPGYPWHYARYHAAYRDRDSYHRPDPTGHDALACISAYLFTGQSGYPDDARLF